MRIVLFCSHFFGKELLEFCLRTKDIEIPLVVTDDPCQNYSNPNGRLWKHGWNKELKELVSSSARQHGIDVFDRRISCSTFESIFKNVRADGILASCFGQMVPTSILNEVNGKSFNLHPVIPGCSINKTSGPRPFHRAAERCASKIQLGVHQMQKEPDAGPILARGKSIWLPNGLFDPTFDGNICCHDHLQFYEELAYTTRELLGDCINQLFIGPSIAVA